MAHFNYNAELKFLKKLKCRQSYLIYGMCVCARICANQVSCAPGGRNSSSHCTKIPLQKTVVSLYKKPSDQYFEFRYHNMTASISKS